MSKSRGKLVGIIFAWLVFSMTFATTAQAEFGLVREYGPNQYTGGATGGPADLASPRHIASDGNSIYVADAGNDRVAVYDLSGNYLRQFGSSGSGQGQFEFPWGIGVAGNDVFVSDYTRDCVLKFRADTGAFVSEWGKGGPPTCSGDHGSVDGEFSNPTGIAVGPDALFVHDFGNDRIQKFSFGGSFLGKVSDPDGSGNFGSVVDMAADGGNTLWATTNGAAVLKMNQASFGNPIQSRTQLPEGYGNGEIADRIYGIDVVTHVDGSGNPTSGRDVYIVDGDGYRIQEFDQNLNYVSHWPKTGQDQFATDPYGVLVVGNRFHVLNGFTENYLSIWGEKSAPPEPVGKAKINKVKVSGPVKVKRKKKATYKVKISNSGDAAATGVRLKVSGKGLSFNTSVGKVGAKKTKTVKVKVKPKKPGKVKVSFKVTSKNAGGKTVKKKIKVKK